VDTNLASTDPIIDSKVAQYVTHLNPSSCGSLPTLLSS